jgi:hypothetical protein
MLHDNKMRHDFEIGRDKKMLHEACANIWSMKKNGTPLQVPHQV